MKNIEKLIKESFSINDLCKKIYGYCNGRTINKINKLIIDGEFNISHFGKGKKNIKYERIYKICPICEVEFETLKHHRDEKTTCSFSCSNKYFQHGINNDDFDIEKYGKRYEKVSISLLENTNRKNLNKELKYCKQCNIDITNKPKRNIFCSNKCRGKNGISDETKEKLSNKAKERIENGIHKGWVSRNIESYPEKFFKKVLENNNIRYELNKPISQKSLGLESQYSYFLDFYIEEGNIDLEIDGEQHKYRQEHDKFRDEFISKQFNVYRIKWKSINTETGKKYIKEEINKFLEYYKLINKKQ